MDFVGWSLMGAGVFLIWCAYKDVSPVAEFQSVVTGTSRPIKGSL